MNLRVSDKRLWAASIMVALALVVITAFSTHQANAQSSYQESEITITSVAEDEIVSGGENAMFIVAASSPLDANITVTVGVSDWRGVVETDSLRDWLDVSGNETFFTREIIIPAGQTDIGLSIPTRSGETGDITVVLIESESYLKIPGPYGSEYDGTYIGDPWYAEVSVQNVATDGPSAGPTVKVELDDHWLYHSVSEGERARFKITATNVSNSRYGWIAVEFKISQSGDLVSGQYANEENIYSFYMPRDGSRIFQVPTRYDSGTQSGSVTMTIVENADYVIERGKKSETIPIYNKDSCEPRPSENCG